MMIAPIENRFDSSKSLFLDTFSFFLFENPAINIPTKPSFKQIATDEKNDQVSIFTRLVAKINDHFFT